MDNPNERSMHTNSTVRGGGLIFVGLFLVALLFQTYLTDNYHIEIFTLFVGALLIAGIGFIDDMYNLSAKTRFVIQCFVAVLISILVTPNTLNLGFMVLKQQYIQMFILFFSALWSINHFNFMDGIDGLCASQAIFLFASYSILFGFHDASIYQAICLMLMASLLGFLMFNFPPAKLFMGDVGSATLGFLTFYLAIIGQKQYQIPFYYLFILNGLFLFDSTITLLRRIFEGEKWFSPHKKHAYQRLKQWGLNTRFILLGQYILNGSLLVMVLLFEGKYISMAFLVFYSMGILCSVYYYVECLYPMFAINKKNSVTN